MPKQYLVHLNEAPNGFSPGTTDAGGTNVKWVIDRRVAGAQQFGMQVNSILPGTKGRPPHVHEISEHGFHVLSGHGEWIVDGEKFELGPTDSLYIPKNTPHQTINTGTEPLTYVVIDVPGDPMDAVWERIGKKDTLPRHG